MACSTLLTADIVNDCSARPTKGIYPTAWVIPYSERAVTLLVNKIQALTSPQGFFSKIEATKMALNAGSDLVVSEVKENGFIHKFSGVLNQVANADLDKMDGIIVVVKRGTTYIAYGVENGLWKTAQSRMANDNSGLVTVEFATRADQEESYSEYYFDTATVGGLFATITPATFVELDEHVTGLTVTTGGDVSSTAIARFSDGTTIIEPSVESAPSTGDVVFFISKGGVLSVTNSGVTGVLYSPTSTDIDTTDCAGLTGINAPLAENIIGHGCAITTWNVDIIMANAVATELTNGTIDISGGTNASYATWSVQAKADKVTLASRDWTITNNA